MEKPRKIIRRLHPVRGASLFAGLMLHPELQSNTHRLEALVHLILGEGNGTKKITKNIALELFSSLNGSFYQSSEDPAEDMMVTVVQHSTGSYRLLEGLWESSAFYLQIFINLVERMPNNEFFVRVKQSIHSILLISDAIIERAGLDRYCVGEPYPLSDIPDEVLCNLSSTKQYVRFTNRELIDLGITPSALSPFIYPLDDRGRLLDVRLGSSPLERSPIIKSNGTCYVLLPTSLSIAIRHLVIDFCINNKMLNSLEDSVKAGYVRHFSEEISLLGKIKDTPFHKINNSKEITCGAHALVNIDEGRYIQFILAFDDFKDYEDGWFNGCSSNGEDDGSAIDEQTRKVHQIVSSKEGFREGLTIVIGCGWGRHMSFPMPEEALKNWNTVSISAPDITTFSMPSASDMDPYSFWRLVDANKILSKTGAHIANINGLLNLYGWAKSNNFHLVPHQEVPQDISPPQISSFFMMIEQSFILNVRSGVHAGLDKHCETTPSGQIKQVQRQAVDWYFDEDRYKPVYASIDDATKGRLLGLVYGVNRKWWCSPVLEGGENKDFIYRTWDAACSWVNRLDKIIEPLISESIIGDITWQWEYSCTYYPDSRLPPPSYADLIAMTSSKIELCGPDVVITSSFSEEFILGFHQEDNHAERAMVTSLIRAVLSTIYDSATLERLTDETSVNVFSDTDAKYVHVLTARSFSDHVKEFMIPPIFVNSFDDATSRIGLGWLAHTHQNGSEINGVEQCTRYLRELVDAVWRKMRELLSVLNKDSTIKFLLKNHEAIDSDSEHWKRTYKAVIGLHEDKDSAASVVSNQISLRNSSSISSRIAIEMAICECDSHGGFHPGKLDITKIITYGALMYHMGGWSDAIRYEMVPPIIRITPFGDVLFDHTFFDSIVVPYGAALHEKILKKKAAIYSKHFEEPIPVKSSKGILGKEFEDVWHSEYGFNIDESRLFVDLLEDKGVLDKSVVLELDEDELLHLGMQGGVSREAILAITDSMMLEERESWESPPCGFHMNDILPWRFRRRLSVISCPILKFNDKLLIAPGLLRNGLVYLLRNSYEASFDENQFTSREMKKWVGMQRNREGHLFNKSVASEFEGFGWKTESDTLLTKLLNKKLDKDYGDIDVIAWNPITGNVLLIECKDLIFAKTPGEIARQIYEFRGVTRANGKPDCLLKHLKRIEVVTSNLDHFKKHIGLNIELTINPCLLFSNLVPLSFVESSTLSNIKVISFDGIKEVCLSY